MQLFLQLKMLSRAVCCAGLV